MPKKTELYSCTTDGKGYKVTKFVNEEYETFHNVLNDDTQTFCDCLGFSHRGACRHIAITDKFKKGGKIDQGFLLNFETGEFTKLVGAD